MQTICLKIPLKPCSTEGVRSWFKTLNKRKEELIATLEKEDVFVESVYLESDKRGDFLIYYMKAVDLKKATEVFLASDDSIDLFHKEQWEKFTLEPIQLECLLDVDRIK